MQTAREADVPAIVRLVCRTGPDAPRWDWPTVISALGAFVAVQDRRIVGVMLLWPHPGHARIEGFMIDPAARGSGVGGALLDHAVLLGGGTVHLLPRTVTPGVLAFALGHGFIETDGVLVKRPA